MVLVEQIEALLDYLEVNREMALGYHKSKEGRSLSKRCWADCARILNSVSANCATKTAEEWRTYYNEFKFKTLKKIKAQKAEQRATGGGTAKKFILTPTQERLYNILGRDVGDPLPDVRHNPLYHGEASQALNAAPTHDITTQDVGQDLADAEACWIDIQPVEPHSDTTNTSGVIEFIMEPQLESTSAPMPESAPMSESILGPMPESIPAPGPYVNNGTGEPPQQRRRLRETRRQRTQRTLTVEEVYKDRDQFAGLVREVAAPDVGRMGIEILSFTIKDVYDDVQYLASLGKAQTAAVKRDADVGVAQANRDAGIREAECDKSAMDVKYSMDTRIEDNARMYKLQKAQFDQEINTAKAEAALAYELQAAKIKQRIRNEEIQIEVVERRKQIEVEQQEIMRREEELMSTVKLPAEAEAYRLQTIAEGKRTQTVEAAKADGERIKVLGLAEATAIGDVGKADAERMLAKAKVYKQYGDAAIMALVLEALPKIAAEVSAPLAKTDEIVLVGDTGATGEVARLASGIPPALKTLTGLDLSAVMKRLHPSEEPNLSAATSKKREVAAF